MDMCHNILLRGFKSEQPGPNYYLPQSNIYGSDIHDYSNNICSVYTWTEFEGKKGMDNIASWILCWLNDEGYYYQSYGKKNNMPKIVIIFDNWGGKNKKNAIISFLNMIREGGLSGTATLYFYIKGHTKNDCDRAFNSLKVLYQKQNVFTFEKYCGILNNKKNVEVIQTFNEKLFDLGSFLDDLYDRTDPKTVNINHVFQVKKDLAYIGYCQEFHGEAESEHNYKNKSAYRNAQRNIVIRNIFKRLKQI